MKSNVIFRSFLHHNHLWVNRRLVL